MMQYLEYWDAPYGEVLALQEDIFRRRVELRRQGMDSGDDIMIFVTHRPVYTLGRHANPDNIINRRWLESRDAEAVETDRGGDVTFHGPGQLVIYPIIDLQRHGLGVKDYVNLLEEGVIRTLADYGVKGERVEGATGVWIEKGFPRERKICAIGIRCSRFITMHGLALNVNTDLSWFSAINPCGFTDKGVTSLWRELPDGGFRPEIRQVATRLRHHLTELLTQATPK